MAPTDKEKIKIISYISILHRRSCFHRRSSTGVVVRASWVTSARSTLAARYELHGCRIALLWLDLNYTDVTGTYNLRHQTL